MGISIGGFDLGINLPSFSATGLSYWLTMGAVFILFVLSGAIVMWLVFQQKLYNKKIILFENIGGMGYQVSGKDRARLLKISESGEEVLFLKKRKVYRTAYGRKMGKNTYWFAVGQDGYWYNILLGDLDAKMGMLDIEPIDRDMRYAHVAIGKNIKDRYHKESFMQKYGQFVFNSIFFLMMIIAIWWLMGKAGDIIGQAKPVAESLKFAAEELKTAYSHLDAICGSSGYKAG